MEYVGEARTLQGDWWAELKASVCKLEQRDGKFAMGLTKWQVPIEPPQC